MSVVATALAKTYLALTDDPPVDLDPSTGKGPEWGKASPVGLLIILLLAIATFFLLRSMTRRLKRVRERAEAADGAAMADATEAGPEVLDPVDVTTSSPTDSIDGQIRPDHGESDHTRD